MNRSPEAAAQAVSLGTLVGLKLTLLRNTLRQAVLQSPLKVSVSTVFLLVIWYGLYRLFGLIFESFSKTPLEAAVVIPVIFNVFFLALLVLLAFSNAVLVYGSMFSRSEPAFLLAAPVQPEHLVLLKYVESLFFASWALILLGLPLMLAMGANFEESAAFYPLFLAFFLCFVPIPGALGLLLAYWAAKVSPGRGERRLIGLGALILLLAALWSLRVARDVELMPERWVSEFFARMEFAQAVLLPSSWVSRGIEQVLRQRHGLALGYLAVTAANAIFLSWVAVKVCGRRFLLTYNRATAVGRSGAPRGNGRRIDVCSAVFYYLPARLRLIAAKDLRTFLRDPLQWSQLVILFGLMALYLLNMPRFYRDFADSSWGLLLPFLNLCAVTLMMATFTTRFVFPLVSLEGHQFWLLGLLPVSRVHILLAKCAYAGTVTVPFATVTTILAARSMSLAWPWAVLHVGAAVSVCLGLCGLAVGLGARLPLFHERNPGRIANGFGGTVNLIASVGLVVIVLSAMALASARVKELDLSQPDKLIVLLLAGACLLAIAGGAGAVWLGARHLRRVEV